MPLLPLPMPLPTQLQKWDTRDHICEGSNETTLGVHLCRHVHDSVCKNSFLLKELEFSILVKMLHNVYGHNTDYVVLSGVLFCCIPSCNCFA